VTKATKQPIGRPANNVVIGKEAAKEIIIEDKPEPISFICGACSGRMEKPYIYCPLCGVNLKWET